MKYITRTVSILSAVSLFTDVASEMLYPIMPVYLKSVGFSILAIGFLEGLAEAFAGLSKGYFGRLSDESGKRVPFVRWGYGLSGLSKPLLVFFSFPLWIFFWRTADRLGKGVRTGARDAMLSDEATVSTKARVFGFHRAMDTAGAVIGPALALAYLYYYPEDYRSLFLAALVPGALALLSTFLLREKPVQAIRSEKRVSFFDFLAYWKKSDPRYRKLVSGLLVFALFNSSDVFLLLKMKESGAGDPEVIGVYIFYNLVFAVSAFPAGALADKLGLKKIFLAGLLAFSLVYFGMAMYTDRKIHFVLFFVYGIYAACTDGIAKAWISNICEKKETATAIGTYTALQSVCTLIASSLAGWIWFAFDAKAVFLLSGSAGLLVFAYMLIKVPVSPGRTKAV